MKHKDIENIKKSAFRIDFKPQFSKYIFKDHVGCVENIKLRLIKYSIQITAYNMSMLIEA